MGLVHIQLSDGAHSLLKKIIKSFKRDNPGVKITQSDVVEAGLQKLKGGYDWSTRRKSK